MRRGRKVDRRFEGKGEGSATLAKEARWAKWHSGGVQAGGVQRGRHSVGRYGISRRSRHPARKAVLVVRAA